MTGVRAMLWKELRESYFGGGRPIVGLVIGALLAILFGVAIPILMGLATPASQRVAYVFAVSGALGGLAVFMSLMGPMATVVDSFAGERERHTLETLLVTPLSDRAILTGKVLAQYIAGWGTVVLLAVSAGATTTVIAGPLGLLVVPAVLVIGLVPGSVAATLIVGAGSLISLRAPTVKKGQERLGYVMIPVFLLPSFSFSIVPLLTGGRSPADLATLGIVLAIAVPLFFLALAVTLLVLLYTRFRRDRLIGLPS